MPARPASTMSRAGCRGATPPAAARCWCSITSARHRTHEPDAGHACRAVRGWPSLRGDCLRACAAHRAPAVAAGAGRGRAPLPAAGTGTGRQGGGGLPA
ncbi:hypothetical protein G6F62_013023 [Rhizopus arrhizus]|nr:hypothetical protein G6F24_016541 [Rhizopus arrhizus]KAG1317215.1 hypothetical protein G6F62_013023 [Rhizopus arrhizus]